MTSPRAHLFGRRGVTAVVALAVGVATVACDDDDPTADAAQFCGEVDANVKTLTKPKWADGEGGIAAYVALYQRLGELAPLAVEEEWTALTELFETASTVDPADRDSVDRLHEQAFRTERSAVEVKRWLKKNCGVNLPVTTIVDHDVKVPVNSTPPTTVPG